ncbi:hypothetical protein A9Q83_05205 [Alphaproteobacteria bacterium 46_93_T64]|nr:hypothetical protein A9Q83_05205 [Alphaproteobacteria bacterium 46_93_T64]
MTLTLPLNHKLASVHQVIPPELLDLKILLYKDNYGYSSAAENLIHLSNIPDENIVSFKSREMLIEAVAHAEGVSISPRKEVAHDRRLVSIPIVGCEIMHLEYLAYHKDRRDVPLITTYIEGWQSKDF